MWFVALILLQFLAVKTLHVKNITGSYEVASGEAQSVSKLLISYKFYGIHGQYAAFRPWILPATQDVGNNQIQLSFEFRTRVENSFLMYLDDRSTSFVALTIKGGYLQLRFTFSETRGILRSDAAVNDHEWHLLKLVYNPVFVTLVVDKTFQTSWMRQIQNSRKFVQRSKTFFGGLPSDIRLQQLALPSTLVQTPFVGEIQNVTANGEKLICLRKHGIRVKQIKHPCSG